MLRLGSLAPNFQAETSQGPIDFHAFKLDKWSVLFSHPDDFTPVCTTELGKVAALHAEFAKRNVLVLGLSCNGIEQHAAWIKDINETQHCKVDFPIVADRTRVVAELYGMLDEQDPTNRTAAGMPLTVRSVFIIDAFNKIRLILTYPASTGRDFTEILRVIDSLLICDARRVATPQGWKVGDDVIVHNSVSDAEAQILFPGFRIVKPYLRFTSLAKEASKL